ncbi:ABC transporter ATP-binding protein [Campylobacter sp. IFREMER_LSEM_CL1846]|uniref:ABC transporter ATP-binding protein n=1 Tax=unclassified Campylobacter TaxID=2593542 RepID=UPI00127FF689|nr:MULTISPECIES: ABC transporter ATP-binding protein [unclassified Campylobacter]EAJ5678760.1 ABC transporter ATP-binding protein [Campylobacter lari]EAK0445262.1 ABC transporter ATP-binding protein [Campylobacter lari]EAK9943633.1 ABC transporter ATP-binding protein [Campylobacter lari]MCV3434914.1 ABC transporter ATP-binding protein [Campylobacter sp. IFREMER_LSEM_CL1846]MCV3462424.1 ABC transporter ATP-binding protein [Campylobacter sp. FU_497]
MELLKAENLSHSFDIPLFENLNFAVNAKDSIAICGSSGCGKSTLLHILSTLLKPQSGKVFYNNQDLYGLNDDALLEIRRKDFGIIFQMHYLFKGFLAFENIELASVLSGQNIDYELLKKLDIADLMNQKITKLSGGQQQRVSIARVLSKKPKIIFADEVTGNLDFKNALNVMDILIDYIKKNNAALIFVTHDQELTKKCDKVFHLSNYGIC